MTTLDITREHGALPRNKCTRKGLGLVTFIAFLLISYSNAAVVNHCGSATITANPAGATNLGAINDEAVCQTGISLFETSTECATVTTSASDTMDVKVDLGAEREIQTIIFLASHDQNWSYTANFESTKRFGSD